MVERCPDLAKRDAVPQVFDALSEADATGTNSCGLPRLMPATDQAIGILSMSSYG